MTNSMPSTLLDEWVEYARLEPFGHPWENWLMAIPAHMYASVKSKKGREPSLQSFYYEDSQSKKEREQSQFLHFLDSYEPKKESH